MAELLKTHKKKPLLFSWQIRLLKRKRQPFKKVKASTLIEVLVASVLIVIIFAIASLTLNTIFKASIKNNTHTIDAHLNKLQYLYTHKKIRINYRENFKNWNITLSKQSINSTNLIIIKALQPKSKKSRIKTLIDAQVQ